MSTTTIIGITIGVIVLCIILCSIIVILIKRKQNEKQPAAPPLPPPRQNGAPAVISPFYEPAPGPTYETIPALQLQMKEKALEEFKLGPGNNHGRHYDLGRTQSSNTYLDTNQLVVDLAGAQIPEDIENAYTKEIEEEPSDGNPNYDRVSLPSIDETYCTAIDAKEDSETLGAVGGNPHYDRMDKIDRYDSPKLDHDRMPVNAEKDYDVVNDVGRKKLLVPSHPTVSDNDYLKVISDNSV